MSKVTALVLAFALALIVVLEACVSSEEAGTGSRAGAPVTTQISPDSARMLARLDSLNRADSLRVRRGGFTSRQDTVVASIVRRTKTSSLKIKPIERPANPAYTVQIGAFARTKYALQAQRLAKERFADLPIFNYYEPFDRLYRVRVGKFDTRAQADSLRKAMLGQFPQDYPDCWINYIAK
ncbi:MAG: SPOR domain-containing protein [Ignavibacteria bacterium]|nr:SPOR domain-containing protein [Ignavibacteria bacterium]